MLILKNNHNILLEKRPHYGIWGALWSFPEIDNIDYFSATCEQRFKCKIVDVATMEPFQHTFSHYHLQITPILLDVLHSNHQVMENEQRIWYNFAKPARKGFATPVKRLLEMLKEQTNEPHDILY